MKNKILKIITVPFVILFFSSSSVAADLNIAFFASSSENGYNQATWEGVKKLQKKQGMLMLRFSMVNLMQRFNMDKLKTLLLQANLMDL